MNLANMHPSPKHNTWNESHCNKRKIDTAFLKRTADEIIIFQLLVLGIELFGGWPERQKKLKDKVSAITYLLLDYWTHFLT